jgi:hypothetical protein
VAALAAHGARSVRRLHAERPPERCRSGRVLLGEPEEKISVEELHACGRQLEERQHAQRPSGVDAFLIDVRP